VVRFFYSREFLVQLHRPSNEGEVGDVVWLRVKLGEGFGDWLFIKQWGEGSGLLAVV